MLWMCNGWVLTTLQLALVGHAFVSCLFFWVPPEGQTTAWHGGWGHSSGLPRQCQTHIRCFIPFICYGCAYGWILFMLQLLLLAMLLEVNTILEFWIHLKRGKPQSSAVVDSREPFKRSPTSNQKHTSCHTTFICCGMCIWMSLCHNTTALIDVM